MKRGELHAPARESSRSESSELSLIWSNQVLHLTSKSGKCICLHHKFRIDSGRTKFWQGQTDGVLYSRELHAWESSRSHWAWLIKPSLASYKQKWKVDVQFAQRKGLKFYQTRSNAVILHDTLPAYYFSKAIEMKSEEIKDQKVYVSPRPPPTISYIDNWTCDLDSDVARSSKDIQRIELKPNTQLLSTGRLVTKWSEETLERTKFDRDTLNQE